MSLSPEARVCWLLLVSLASSSAQDPASGGEATVSPQKECTSVHCTLYTVPYAPCRTNPPPRVSSSPSPVPPSSSQFLILYESFSLNCLPEALSTAPSRLSCARPPCTPVAALPGDLAAPTLHSFASPLPYSLSTYLPTYLHTYILTCLPTVALDLDISTGPTSPTAAKFDGSSCFMLPVPSHSGSRSPPHLRPSPTLHQLGHARFRY